MSKRVDSKLLQDIQEFILNYTASHHYPPTQREIAEGCRSSKTRINVYLRILESKGLVQPFYGGARCVVLNNGYCSSCGRALK